jgi:hypothetical protein
MNKILLGFVNSFILKTPSVGDTQVKHAILEFSRFEKMKNSLCGPASGLLYHLPVFKDFQQNIWLIHF